MPILLRQWSDRYNGKDLPRLRIKKIDGISRDVGYRHGFATIDRQYMVRRHQALERLSCNKVRGDLARVQIEYSHPILGQVEAPRSVIHRCVIPNPIGRTTPNGCGQPIEARVRSGLATVSSD